MRPVGLTLAVLLSAAAAAIAQTPIAPGYPSAPITPAPLPTPGTGVPAIPVSAGAALAPLAAPGAPAGSTLDVHLAAWERAMSGTINFRSDFETTRTEAVFGKQRIYVGSVLCMKPNLARLRLSESANPANYEAYICNGKSVFAYDGSAKTLTEHTMDANAATAGGDNLMLDFLSGMKAEDAKRRFDLTLSKEDQNYVYLDIKPKLPRDRQEFEQVRFAIYGPNTKHLAYLPAQVLVKKPNGDTEVWKFSNPQTNLQGVEAKFFQAEKPPDGWQIRRAPAGGAAPAPGPGGRPMK